MESPKPRRRPKQANPVASLAQDASISFCWIPQQRRPPKRLSTSAPPSPPLPKTRPRATTKLSSPSAVCNDSNQFLIHPFLIQPLITFLDRRQQLFRMRLDRILPRLGDAKRGHRLLIANF